MVVSIEEKIKQKYSDYIMVINRKTTPSMADESIDIGRPHLFSNPYFIGQDGDRLEVIRKYRRHLWHEIQNINSPVYFQLFNIALDVIQGKSIDLVCFCKPKPCHGDVLKSAILWLIADQKIELERTLQP